MPALRSPEPVYDPWDRYYCGDRSTSPHGVWIDMTNPANPSREVVEDQLREQGWIYLRGTITRWEDPHGWYCPHHPPQVHDGSKPSRPA